MYLNLQTRNVYNPVVVHAPASFCVFIATAEEPTGDAPNVNVQVTGPPGAAEEQDPADGLTVSDVPPISPDSRTPNIN